MFSIRVNYERPVWTLDQRRHLTKRDKSVFRNQTSRNAYFDSSGPPMLIFSSTRKKFILWFRHNHAGVTYVYAVYVQKKVRLGRSTRSTSCHGIMYLRYLCNKAESCVRDASQHGLSHKIYDKSTCAGAKKGKRSKAHSGFTTNVEVGHRYLSVPYLIVQRPMRGTAHSGARRKTFRGLGS